MKDIQLRSNISYGILLFDYSDKSLFNKIKQQPDKQQIYMQLYQDFMWKQQVNLLCVQRKYTFSFNDFVFGKYEQRKNPKYDIDQLLNHITVDEINLIKNNHMVPLSKMIGLDLSKNGNKQKIMCQEQKYNKFKMYINKHYDRLIKQQSNYKPQWSIPKGKRMLYEKQFGTALRELYEETHVNIDPNDTDNVIIMPQENPISHTFIGNNFEKYTNIYYVVITNNIQNNLGDLVLMSDNANEICKSEFLNYQQFMDNFDPVQQVTFKNSFINYIEN